MAWKFLGNFPWFILADIELTVHDSIQSLFTPESYVHRRFFFFFFLFITYPLFVHIFLSFFRLLLFLIFIYYYMRYLTYFAIALFRYSDIFSNFYDYFLQFLIASSFRILISFFLIFSFVYFLVYFCHLLLSRSIFKTSSNILPHLKGRNKLILFSNWSLKRAS